MVTLQPWSISVYHVICQCIEIDAEQQSKCEISISYRIALHVMMPVGNISQEVLKPTDRSIDR